MKLPEAAQATVSRFKVVNYLLSVTHPDGRSKAQFFLRFGFSADDWEAMAQALLQHAEDHEVTRHETSEFGTC